MTELHKFLFEGLPVRGMLVRLTDSWKEVLRRRTSEDAYDEPVRQLLGEMTAAGVLMQANIKFNGALILQIFGDGPVKLAVTEVQSDLAFRSTAKVVGAVPSSDSGHLPLDVLVNLSNEGRCAITLDPQGKVPGQQPYQGVVPLYDDERKALPQLGQVLEHYMLQSEQLDTKLILAANDEIAAGLLIQRLPMQGQGNLEGQGLDEDEIGLNESYNRIAHLASTLKRDELLSLDAQTILHRLFWEETVLLFDPLKGVDAPRFECTCSRTRVTNMLRNLGREEADSIIAEQGQIDVGCEFCGEHYRFDKIDVSEIFSEEVPTPPESGLLQ